MNKQKKQIIILACLIVVFITVSINAVISVRKSLARMSKAAAVVPMQPAKALTAPTAPGQQPAPEAPTAKPIEQAGWGVDPFSGRPISVETGGISEIKLSGIVYSAKNPKESYAIINNDIIGIGGKVGDSQLKIVNITQDEVTLNDGTKDIKLRVR